MLILKNNKKNEKKVEGNLKTIYHYLNNENEKIEKEEKK